MANKEKSESPYDYNLPIESDGGLREWSRYDDDWSLNHNGHKQIERADFAVVIRMNDILTKEYKKRGGTYE